MWWALSLVTASTSGDFRRLKLSENSTLFQRTAASSDLIVAFTPRQGKLVRSAAVFLAAMPGDTDVLFVSPRRSQQTPWREVDGHTGGLQGFFADVNQVFLTHAYQRLHVMGLSFGAPLALITGLALPSWSVTAVGLLSDIEQLEADYSEELGLLANRGISVREPGPRKVSFVVGRFNHRDWGLASNLVTQIESARVVSVRTNNHNPLYPLHRGGQLPAFLAGLVAGFPADPLKPTDKLVEIDSR
jgi:pimeloyl-ACP methyl ester carboxylesterase